MKQIALLLLITLTTLHAQAQWTTASPHIYYNAGNVGIGTTSPRGKFDVDGPGNIYLSDETNGGSSQNIYIPGHIYLSPFSGGNVCYVQARRADDSGTAALRFRTTNSGSLVEAMHIAGNGNIGIGTISPDQKLTVNGIIHTIEVIIDPTVPTPDYVFEKDYDLPSLEEVKTYIDQNKHLPEVPSAKQIEKEGLKTGEMNLLLLKKVEELTLYLIEQNAKMELQQKQIEELKNLINTSDSMKHGSGN